MMSLFSSAYPAPEGACVRETNIVEDPLAELTSVGAALHLVFRPWQVRTLWIAK